MTDHEGVNKKGFNLQDFQQGNPEAFKGFFLGSFGEFFSFANLLLRDKTSAKKLTSAAFFILWEKHRDFDSERNIRAFLFTCIRDGSFQYLRHLQQSPGAGEYDPGAIFPGSLPEELRQELLAYADGFGPTE
jgi:DNA-directed RNA polymerase specialized sigma24 family protein